MPDTDRLTELEIALAHQERLADDLSDVIRAQSDRIDRLERILLRLAQRVEAAGDDAETPAANVAPPHW